MLTYCESFLHADAVRVYSGLAWAEIDRDTLRVIAHNPGTPVSPGLTDAEITEAKKTVSSMRPAPFRGDVYIRFGHLPKGGRSTNYSTGEKEPGVSCYYARWDIVKSCFVRCVSGLDGAMISYLIKGAPVYLITGTENGIGSDGEPTVKKPAVLCELRYNPETDGYTIK